MLTGAVTAALAGFSPGAGTGEQRWFLVLWMLLASVLLVAYGILVNLPFIAIQRYNRLRIDALLTRRRQRPSGRSKPGTA